jgi:hypothetical protein
LGQPRIKIKILLYGTRGYEKSKERMQKKWITKISTVTNQAENKIAVVPERLGKTNPRMRFDGTAIINLNIQSSVR